MNAEEKLFTQKRLGRILNISHVALVKRLKKIECSFIKVIGSTKPVKAYKANDLPADYQNKLKESGIEIESQSDNKINISKANANFTSVYLLAKPINQRKAVLKCRFVEFYLARDASLNANEWVEKTLHDNMDFDLLGNVTYKQVSDWKSKYLEAKAKGLNVVECFIDIRGAKKHTTALSIEQQEMAVRFFLKKSHPLMTNIHFIMSEHFGDDMPSYDALNNFYKRWKKENPQTYLFSKSPDKWKNSFLVAIGDESEKAKYRNHYWEFDATPADVICSDGKRYTILGLIDIATRRSIFIVEDSNSSFAVSRLLRAGILKFGIPENIVVDNGKEFVSNHFESMCLNLDIQVHVTPPFSGDKKPFVERVFGTLARGLFRELHGFIGHNVGMREEIQARKSFGHKIMAKMKHNADLRTKEEENAYANLCKLSKDNIGIELEFAITKEQLQNSIETWNTKKYEQTYHGGLKEKPINAWNSYSTPVESISDESMLDLLLGKSMKRKVGKKGINFEGCEYWDNELNVWMGKDVKIMLREDMGEVIVYDIESMKLICKAIDTVHSGQSREMASRAKAEQRKLVSQMARTVKKAVEMDDPTLMSVLEAKKEQIIATTVATTKKTAVTEMLLNESHILEANDKEKLEESNHYDFKNKDGEGKPTKILEGGRPAFTSFKDDFLWCLKNNTWSERDLRSRKKRPDTYEDALVEFNNRKIA
ncbi:transposase family protein [Sulfurimonas sp.]|uniref:transposase family protein n=1 Tax=Sulfurimonas sp. TaxID=2022749 RepID=UPI0025E5E688|nr:transposase family protein [Sulfurimonas sp.]